MGVGFPALGVHQRLRRLPCEFQLRLEAAVLESDLFVVGPLFFEDLALLRGQRRETFGVSALLRPSLGCDGPA